jgi:hypothetical protein
LNANIWATANPLWPFIAQCQASMLVGRFIHVTAATGKNLFGQPGLA